jgi:hypothetical protein
MKVTGDSYAGFVTLDSGTDTSFVSAQAVNPKAIIAMTAPFKEGANSVKRIFGIVYLCISIASVFDLRH